MRVDELFELAGEPVEKATAADIAKCESQTAMRLPEDYKDFVSSYGSGSIEGFIWIFNPASQIPGLKLAEEAATLRAHLLAVDPSRAELYAWGRTFDGDYLCWDVTEAPPDDWQVVVREARGGRTEAFPSGCIDFLDSLFQGRVSSKILPPDLATERGRRPRFAPYGSD